MRSRRPDLVPFLALLVALAFLATACHPPITITTPQGKIVYTANEVAKRVETLQAAAIAGEAQGVLPTDVARVFVQFSVSAAKTLQTLPSGWGTTVAVAWGEAKQQIPLRYLNNPTVATAVMAVDTVLAIWLPVSTGGGL
jgi:hypothetical protein